MVAQNGSPNGTQMLPTFYRIVFKFYTLARIPPAPLSNRRMMDSRFESLGRLGGHGVCLGTPGASFFEPLGSFGDHFGSLGDHFGSLWGSFWEPWGVLG